MIVDWVHSHYRSLLFSLAALAVAGLASVWVFPVALFPQVHYPRVVVDFTAGDRPAERMATEVTYVAEEAVRGVPGAQSIRSITSRGSAQISANFPWDTDMMTATLQVQSAVSQIAPTMPAGTTFTVRQMDPTVFPVIAYSLTSATRGGVELYDLAQYQLRPLLSTVPGVAKIDVQGGGLEEFRIEVDPARLAGLNLSLTDLSTALANANVLTAVGKLEDHDKLYLIVNNTTFTRLDELGSTVVRADANGVIRLADIARIYKTAAPAWSRVTADGHDAVLLNVFQQPGGNTVEIAAGIKAKLAELQSGLPADVKVANWYDQSQLIVSSAASVRDAVLIGVILAMLLLLIFLRSWKTTLIAAIVVPSVLAVTVLLLWALGMSFNIMTLGGMAAAVGLIIDDAIVMIEHIIRRLRGLLDVPPDSRVRLAATEFTRPLMGSSAATIIIHLPLAFLGGVAGAFFKILSLTIVASLTISFLVVWLVVPVLSGRLLKARDAEKKEAGFIMRGLHRAHERVMGLLLPRPWLALVIIVPLLAAGYFCYMRAGTGFMPKMDEGGFVLDYKAKPGTSLTETDRLLRQVEGILRETPEVDTYSRRTGQQLGGGVTEAMEGDFFVRLKPQPRRDIEAVMDEVRGKVQRGVPGLDIEILQLMEDLIGDLTAVPQPIEIELFSDDPKALSDLAPKVAKALEGVEGVVDINNGLAIAGDALDVKVDRVKAGLEGIDPDAAAKMLTQYLTGQVSTQVLRGPKIIGVRVWIPEAERSRQGDIGKLQLKAPDGHVFSLERIATVTPVTGQPQIKRDNLKRMVAVTGRISGRDLGSTVRDVKAMLARPGLLPPGLYYRLGGIYQQQQVAFRGMLMVLAAAVVLVFLLLLFLYDSFAVAVSMLLTTLLAGAAVFVGLWLTGTELNITAMMGLTMVVGNVTEVCIFYFSEYRELTDEPGRRFYRLIQAGINRMRPITMTTLAAIFALLPLAIGLWPGSAMQRPLAIAIISGLAVQLPLALIILPAFLTMFGAAGRAAKAYHV